MLIFEIIFENWKRRAVHSQQMLTQELEFLSQSEKTSFFVNFPLNQKLTKKIMITK